MKQPLAATGLDDNSNMFPCQFKLPLSPIRTSISHCTGQKKTTIFQKSKVITSQLLTLASKMANISTLLVILIAAIWAGGPHHPVSAAPTYQESIQKIRWDVSLTDTRPKKKRVDVQPPTLMVEQSACDVTPPWIVYMNFGAMINGNDAQRTVALMDEKISHFPCAKNKNIAKFLGYNIPLEVEILMNDQSLYNVITVSNGTAVLEAGNIQHSGIGTILNYFTTKAFYANNNVKARDLTFNVFIKELFEVTLQSPLPLTNSFKAAYSKLPDEYSGNQQIFYNFISTYGTHYVYKIVYGGFYARVVDYTLNETTTGQYNGSSMSWLNSREHIRAYTKGGTGLDNQTRASWIKTLLDHPVPVTVLPYPITGLADPEDKNHARNRAIMSSIEDAKIRNRVTPIAKELITVLQKVEKKNQIVKFVINQLERELEYIIPSQSFIYAIKNELASNPEFSNLWLECWIGGKVLEYYMIPGLCISFDRTKCDDVHKKIPTGGKYILYFYKQWDCRGVGIYMSIDALMNVENDVMNKFSSFRIDFTG